MDKFCICGARVECDSGGYPVVDGSAEWALWQMEQGKWVYNPSLEKHKSDKLDTRYLHAYGKFGQDVVVKNILTEIDSILGSANISHWTNYAEPTGWQLYEEPKPETAFKVGDWVEIEVSGVLSQQQATSGAFADSIKCGGVEFYANGNPVMQPLNARIIRKLSGCEVKVRVALEGTVKPCSVNTFELCTNEGSYWIGWKELDLDTAALVQALLKAQEVKNG